MKAKTATPTRLMSIKDAASYLGIGRTTMYHTIKRAFWLSFKRHISRVKVRQGNSRRGQARKGLARGVAILGARRGFGYAAARLDHKGKALSSLLVESKDIGWKSLWLYRKYNPLLE